MSLSLSHTHTHTHTHIYTHVGFLGDTEVKNQPANTGDAGDSGLIPGLGRSPGGGNSNPLQYSCLKNPKDRGAWRATVHGGRKELDRTERLNAHFLFTA